MPPLSVRNIDARLFRRDHNHNISGSRSIIGVEDTKLYPIRGQAILVKSPQLREFLAVEIGAYRLQNSASTKPAN